MNIDQLNDGFRLLVRELLGLPANSVRLADQNAPIGNDPFVTVKFTTLAETGQDSHSYSAIGVTNNVLETGIGQRKLAISIQFFKGNATYQASRLKTLLTMETGSTKLRAIGLGYIKTSSVRDLSVSVGTYFEPRSQIDLHVHVIAKETAVTPTILRAPISMKTENILTNSEVFKP